MPAIHNHLTNTSKISSHGVSLSRTSNFRPLVSGDILLIRVKEEDLDKTRLMVQIQWLAFRMAAISRAAEVVDDLDAEPPSNTQELPTYPKGFLEFLASETEEFYMCFCPGAGRCTPHNDGQFLLMSKRLAQEIAHPNKHPNKVEV
ncbi:unnamed protein product [Clonostachys solani]|uniref:Uncharacterized protein n=1 Tax=Clonostachys solani TaxID=160281 RepID=A0A9N9ZJM1_9HYPO|nr:unnamed protein product [Clonostachys solani]